MSAERELLDRALHTLVCAWAFDEALQSGETDAEELAELRGHGVASGDLHTHLPTRLNATAVTRSMDRRSIGGTSRADIQK